MASAQADGGLTIRPFEAADLPHLQAVRRAAFGPVFASFRAIVGEQIFAHALQDADGEQAAHLSGLCDPDADASVVVAEVGGEIVGFASYTLDAEKRVGEIGLNAVHPDHAGAGIGARLYEFVLDRMREQGMAVATVSTGGDASHAPARRAYEKVGFGSALPSVTLYRRL